MADPLPGSGAAGASLPILIGITGASGSLYALRLVHHLKSLGREVWVIASDKGREVCRFEKCEALFKSVDREFRNSDLFAPTASGTFRHAGMAIVPCSMGTLAKVAHGISDSLLTRSADVCLKERRPLLVVPRETPMSSLHLQNQKILCDLGAVILPASPSFYHHPRTVEEVVDTVVARILDHLGVDHHIAPRWKEG